MAIFTNGNIVTMGKEEKAQAFCVREGKFKFVGSSEEALKLKQPDEEFIDLEGRTVLPGFNDSHMHFLGYAVDKSRVDLSKVTSIEEMIRRVKKYIADKSIPQGKWVICRGWNENLFEERRLPNKYDLDKISSKHLIFISRACNHIGVANSLALEKLNIGIDTENPKRGIIDKNYNGPTGILRENALNLVFNALPEMSKEEIKNVLKEAFNDALSCGLTTIHSEDMGQAGSLNSLIAAYKELDEQQELPLRIVLQLNLPNEENIQYAKSLGLKTGAGGDMYKIGALKLYQDGSLGGRTAAMEQNYNDIASNGVAIYKQEELNNMVSAAHKAGFQPAIHAIGDRAMNMILEAYAKVKGNYPNEDLRPVIIHCQFTNPGIIDKFKKLGVIANVQPSFVMTDHPIVEKAVGKERAHYSYTWRTLLEEGIHTSFSSDAPIESFNPLYGIYAAVNRKNLEGKPNGGWNPEQIVDVNKAIYAFTMGSAYMNFEENIKGSISSEKLADFIVLSEDIFNIPSEKIKDIKVIAAYVNGKRVYNAGISY